jgi:hypothetical protein
MTINLEQRHMEPSWQQLKLVKVESTVALWSLAKDYIAGSRLLRFTVVDKDEQKQTASISWSPIKGTMCGANGIVANPPKSGCLSTGAPYGALIGKLGGSSADIPDSSTPTAPYGTKRVFAIGTHCVIALGGSEGGPLYLTMNDSPDGFANHSGDLHVLIEEYGT